MLSPIRVGKVAVLAIAAGGPYLASETQWGRETSGSVGQWVSGMPAEVSGGDYAQHAHHEVETLRPVAATRYRYDTVTAQKLGAIASNEPLPNLVGPNVTDLREVLRFDLTSDMVLARFARVSTVLADLQLTGLRVPIVTGTQADDLAGTLTYYFDGSGQIQRISLHGFTGNPDRIRETLAGFYGLQPEPTLEAGVMAKRWNGIPVHLLRLTHAPVVYSDAVHQKFTVFLELNQPNLRYGISDEAKKIVSADRWTGRW